MKQLILVGNQKVKFQDTETIISLTLVSDGNTVTIDKDKTYSIKIKNGTGYVKSLDATPNTTNNMVTFSTSGFDGLPVDAYFIELWVIDTNGQTIYPSDSFIELDITANATGVEGQVLPAITMQEFEERFSTLQSNLETKVGTLIGPTGPTGNGINTVVTEYQLSASGSDVPTGTWNDSPVTPTDDLPYMWTRNVTTYTDKSTHVSYNISAKGTKGNNFTIQGSTSSIAGLPSVGTDGEGYMVGTELYVWTNGKWNDIVDMKGVQGDKGDQGIQGLKGDTGTGISSITTEYELSNQGTAIPSTGWSSTLLTMTNDLPYLWTRVTITFTNGSKNMVYFTSNKGDKGDTGEKGDKGDTGANLAVKGAVDKDTELPSSGNTEGDAYMVGTNLYVYTSGAWKNCGPIVAENTVLYNADGSLNIKGTNYNYVQDLRNGKIQYNDGTKNIELTPVDSQQEAKDILSARNYTDSSISSLSTSINTKLSGYATNSQLATKADDSKVVHSTDMRKPAGDVAGIEEVNAKQDKIGYTPADDSKVVHDNHDGTEQLNGVQVQPFNKLSDTIGGRNLLINSQNPSATNRVKFANAVGPDILGTVTFSNGYTKLASAVTSTAAETAYRFNHPDFALMPLPSGTYTLVVDLTSSDNVYVSPVAQFSTNGNTPQSLSTPKWKLSSTENQFSYTFTISSNTTGWFISLEMYADVNRTFDNTGKSFQFRNASIQKGSVATDSSPAPEDKVNVSDMRKPASDVVGLEDVSTSVYKGILAENTDLNTLTQEGIYNFSGTSFVNFIDSDSHWGTIQIINKAALLVQYVICTSNVLDQIFFRTKSGNPSTWFPWTMVPRFSTDNSLELPNGEHLKLADDSQVAHLSGANNFDTVPTVKNNPLLLASSLPSDLARTGSDQEFTGKNTFDTAPIDKVTGNPYITKSDVPKVDLSSYATNSQLATKADDSKVVHNTGTEEISGQKTFDTAPIDKTTGNPYITKSGVPAVPSTLADTTKDANFTGKLQKSGIDVATTTDVTNAVSGATSQVAHLVGTNNFTGSIQHNGNPVGAHIQASKNDEDSAISDSTKGNPDDIYYWLEN